MVFSLNAFKIKHESVMYYLASDNTFPLSDHEN